MIKNQLAALGINVTVNVSDSAGLYAVMLNNTFDMAISVWVAIAGDPDYGMYPVFHSTMTKSGNFPAVNDPRIDRYLETGRFAADPAQRMAIYHDLQRYLAQGASNMFEAFLHGPALTPLKLFG